MDSHSLIKGLKQQKQGQISKLQLKAEAEIELLESIRDYMSVSFYRKVFKSFIKQRRSEIENQYCKVFIHFH